MENYWYFTVLICPVDVDDKELHVLPMFQETKKEPRAKATRGRRYCSLSMSKLIIFSKSVNQVCLKFMIYNFVLITNQGYF